MKKAKNTKRTTSVRSKKTKKTRAVEQNMAKKVSAIILTVLIAGIAVISASYVIKSFMNKQAQEFIEEEKVAEEINSLLPLFTVTQAKTGKHFFAHSKGVVDFFFIIFVRSINQYAVCKLLEA